VIVKFKNYKKRETFSFSFFVLIFSTITNPTLAMEKSGDFSRLYSHSISTLKIREQPSIP